MWFNKGDLHGEIDIRDLNFDSTPETRDLTKKDIVCIAGDFGLFWEQEMSSEEKYWLDWLKAKPYTTCFLDGNHENHPRINQFDEIDYLGGKAGQAYDGIFHLKRGEIYTYEGKKIFTFGGAASHDKAYRKEYVSWWREEEPSFAQISHAMSNLEKYNYKVDFVITHTLPKVKLETMGFGSGYMKCQAAEFFDNLLDRLEFQKWYCGHMHEEIVSGKFNILYHNLVKMI